MTAVLVLLLGLLIAAMGVALVVRGTFTLGAEGRPWLNRFVLAFWQTEPIRFHPITARVLGVLLLVVGGGAAALAVRDLL